MEEPKTVRKLQYNEQETVWFSHSAGVVTVGLTQKALDDIGGAEDVRLPDEGQELDQGDGAVEIEGPEGEFVVLAPLGGRVVEVNSTLESVPAALNEDPDAEGWLFRMEVEDEDELG
jgi:glycine cleavage system H protein